MTVSTIRIEEVRELAMQILLKRGATQREAEQVAEDYIDADLRGRSSHGLAFFKTAVAAFDNKGTYEAEPITGSFLHIKGNRDIGHTVARDAIDMALPYLAERKIMAIGIGNATRFNCPGILARYGAERGAITLVFAYGGTSVMAPPGGTQAATNNTPIGIAFPNTDPLFVLDMALSERAWGHVSLAKFKGETVPSHWGIDKEGQPTTDPAEVKVLNPFGGYKGFGLALAFEMLSGALVGVPIGSKGPGDKRGAFILLLDPTIFGHTVDSFREQVTAFLNEVTAVPTLDGAPAITYPGQASDKRYKEALASGVLTLPDVTIAYLRGLAAE